MENKRGKKQYGENRLVLELESLNCFEELVLEGSVHPQPKYGKNNKYMVCWIFF
jgi:hypothetical protein